MSVGWNYWPIQDISVSLTVYAAPIALIWFLFFFNSDYIADKGAWANL